MAKFLSPYTGQSFEYADPEINWQNIISQGLLPDPSDQQYSWANAYGSSSALKNLYQQNPTMFRPEQKKAFGIPDIAMTNIPTGYNPATDPYTSDPVYMKNQKDINDLKVKMDAASLSLINSIESQYNAIIEQQKQINRGLEKSLNQSLIQGGSQKYAQISSAYNMANQMTFGLNEIAKWEGKKQESIANAKLAAEKNNFQLLELEMENVKDAQDNKEKAMKALSEKLVKQNETLKSESAIYDVVKAIQTEKPGEKLDKMEIYNRLKEIGNEDVKTEDIDNFISNLIPEPSKDTSKNAYSFKQEDVGKLISVGFTGEDIQAAQDVFNSHGLYGKVPELGDKSLAEFLPANQLKTVKEILYPPPKKEKGGAGFETFGEQADALSLARMVFGGGRAMSDTDREQGEILFKAGQAEGLDVFEMANRASGFIIKRNKPLADGLRNTLLGFDEELGMTDYDMAGLARLINEGQDVKAIEKVERAGYAKAEKENPDSFVSEANASYYSSKVSEIKKVLKENGLLDAIGPLEGSFSSIFGKLPLFKRQQAANVQAKVTSLVAEMRNRLSGTNVTESEQKFLEPLIAKLSDKKGVFLTKLDELEGDTLSRLNSNRRTIGMPELTRDSLNNKMLRIPLYSTKSEFDDFLENSFDDSSWKGVPYNSSVWQ